MPSALPPAAAVCAELCVGLLADVPLPDELAPPGADVPFVGVVLSVSAEMVRLLALTGMAAVLSMKAFESVMNTPTAMPAPEPLDVASAVVVTLLFTFEEIVTLPLAAEIVLVSDSWLVAWARSVDAAIAEPFPLASSQLPESECGAVVLGVMSFLAEYRLLSNGSMTTSFLR